MAVHLERLSSGYRINRAADDAAGLAISEEMRRQITGLTKGAENTQQGINLLKTAEGACEEIHAMLRRMQELAVQSSNGIYAETDRAKLDEEFRELQDEIDRISQATNFNGINLLDGTHSRSAYAQTNTIRALNAAVAPLVANSTLSPLAEAAALPAQKTPPTGAATWSATGTNEITISSAGVFDISGLNGYVIKVAATAGQVHFKQTNPAQVNNISIQCQGSNTDLFIENLNTLNTTSTAAGHRNTISFTGANNTLNLIGTNNLTQYVATRGTTRYSSMALINVGGTTELTIQEASGHSGVLNATIDGDAILYNANDNRGAAIIYDGKLYKGYAEVAVDHTAIWHLEEVEDAPEPPDPPEPPIPTDPPEHGDGGLIIHWGPNSDNFVRIYLEGTSCAHLGLTGTSIQMAGSANIALSKIATAIDLVSTRRTEMGAYHNRLEHMLSSNLITKEALTSAESTIRDADMAKEYMVFAKQEMLVQFSQAMLAHSSRQPQRVLQFLS